MNIEKNSTDFIYEIPKDTGIASIQHCKIDIGDIFPDKFYEITNSHIRKIQGILFRYDVVIFMARKAISFYKALILNGELQISTTCEIYSSRILNYNVWEALRDKKVALVDDVVIKGASLAEATQILNEHNIHVDIYIAAWMSHEDSNEINDNDQRWYCQILQSIQKPFVYLNEVDIYSYTNYITRYIEASMLPYNIDQPTVLIKYEKEQLKSFFDDHRVTDITSSIQKKYGIENKVIHYNGEILRPVLGSVNLNLNEVYIKIRIFHDVDSEELLLFPIILFPEIPVDIIDHIYRHIQTDKLDQLIQSENESLVKENKVNVLMYALNYYILSRFLWCEKEHGRDFEYLWIDSNEKILFSKSILTPEFIQIALNQKISKLRMPYKYEQKTQIRPMCFNEYLGAAYVMIFAGINCEEYKQNSKRFIDAEGKEIKRKIITLHGLFDKLKKYAVSKQTFSEDENLGNIDHVDFCIVSNIIDVLIDRGMLVPEIVHTPKSNIVRAYRCGEVAKLSYKEFELFSYMLSHYAGHIWENDEVREKVPNSPKYIGKREAEQLCVLFFRKAARLGLFEKLYNLSERVDEDDTYSIYYTLYGPTISRTINRKYEVNERDTLVDALVSYGYVQEAECDEYTISEIKFEDLDNRWKRFAHNFANEMLFLKNCFLSREDRENFFESQNKRPRISDVDQLKRSVLSRVRSFEQLLTIMSIGENEMQRTLSIVADIKVISDMKVDQTHTAMLYIKNHIKCIGEGIWKSRCFMTDNLLEDIQNMLMENRSFRDRSDISNIFQDHVDASHRVDRNSVIVDFLIKCSEFFYRTYYTVCIINEYMDNKVDLEEKYTIPIRIKYEKRYKKLRKKIKSEYDKSSKRERLGKSKTDLQRLQREATAMLDICDLYTIKSAFGYEPYYHSIIVCADNPDITKKIRFDSLPCNYNESRSGMLGENLFFSCCLLASDRQMNKDKMIGLIKSNVEKIVTSLLEGNFIDKPITIIFYTAHNWYESLLFSGDTVIGKFVEKIIKDTLALEKKWGRNNEIEMFMCGLSGRIQNIDCEIKSPYFKIRDRRGECTIQDTYFISNYSVQITASRDSKTGAINIGTFEGNLAMNAHDSTFIGTRKE